MATSDFLTACTDPNARIVRKDFNGPVPRGAIEMEKAFRESEYYQRLLQDIENYEQTLHESDCSDAPMFKNTVQQAKSRTVSKRSPYTVSFIRCRH